MTIDLEAESSTAARLCLEAQQRLEHAVAALDDDAMRGASRLPGWSRAHVITHLARNADAHARRIAGALEGHDVPKYAGGEEQRADEIERGARRTTREILDDLHASQAALAGVLREAMTAEWPHADFTGGGSYGVGACPAHRLREVEMHHVDLGIGYTPADWPQEYVEWETRWLITSVPDRLRDPSDQRIFLAWMAGRGSADASWRRHPWG